MKVLKFGGTSVANATTWKQVYTILNQNDACVVVVSATAKTTNNLLEISNLAKAKQVNEANEIAEVIKNRHIEIIDELIDKTKHHELYATCEHWINKHLELLHDYILGISTLGELTDRSLDAISSIGERLSSFLIAQIGPLYGVDSIHIDSKKIIKTDSTFGKAVPNQAEIKKSSSLLLDQLKSNKTIIMGGFYGSDSYGITTTLGRGGSDFSASLVGLAIDASDIEIWTDVSGMYTCDPRKVPDASSIPEISFNEAAELAYFGARVLHPSTIQPAVEKNIPVWVKNTFDHTHPGTRISAEAKMNSNIRAIAFKKDITILTVSSTRMLLAYGFLSRVFKIFDKYKVPVDLVTTSEVSVSMSIDSIQHADQIIHELMEIGHVSVKTDMALVCLVGQNFLEMKGVAAQVFNTIKTTPIQLISQGSSDINLSFVVNNNHLDTVVLELHKEFFN